MLASSFVGVAAELLTPFHYHSLATPSGSATIPECLSDIAMNYAVAAALGMMQGVALPMQANSKQDLQAIPWRCSVFTTEHSRLLPPMVQRLNMDAEAGHSNRIYNGASKGNLKDFYRIQEVDRGSVFQGVIFGDNPFEQYQLNELIVRVGKHRRGLVRLMPDNSVANVYLNAYTANLFDQTERVERFLLHTLQLTGAQSAQSALERVRLWV